MASMYNENLKITIFGESHQEHLGVVIDNLSAGIKIDTDFIKKELRRRKGDESLSTKRQENDEQFKIISGIFNDYTTGSPICILFDNKDQASKDYIPGVCRPSHADYTNFIRSHGFNDYRGGGHSSGRLTAPLVACGAICKQILKSKNIIIASHVSSLKKINDDPIEKASLDVIESLNEQAFPVINKNIKEKMKKEILKCKKDKDSVGGTIQTIILNVKPGIGSPFFNSLESEIARLLFSIPAVKGVDFGLGFDFAKYNGSQVNDPFTYKDAKVVTTSNYNGGINGGISNGMPILFKCVIKPTPSIGLKQNTINVFKEKDMSLNLKGRHDAAIISRSCVIVEAVTAIALLNLYMDKYGYEWTK